MIFAATWVSRLTTFFFIEGAAEGGNLETLVVLCELLPLHFSQTLRRIQNKIASNHLTSSLMANRLLFAVGLQR